MRNGKPSTAMKGFTGILNDKEMEAVTEFVRHEFMVKKNENTALPHQGKRLARPRAPRRRFPFARGELAIDTPWEKLTPEQQQGMRLFRTACITCHDHGKVNDPGKVWDTPR